jgi:hypothetical protein
MDVFVKIDATSGNGLGPDFQLTSNFGSVSPFLVTRDELVNGIIVSVDNLATVIVITSLGNCSNSVSIAISGITTTTSTTTTAPTTTTSTSTTSTSSTSTTSTSTSSTSSTTTIPPSTTTSTSTSSTTSTSTTSTSTSTSSTTSTTTTPPPVCNCYRLQNQGVFPSTYSYTACNGNVFDFLVIGAGVTVYICAVVGSVVPGPEVNQLDLETNCLDSPGCTPTD